MDFVRRLNKRDTPYIIADEVFELTDGKCGRYLDHDNVNPKTIECFTQPLRQGEKLLTYTAETKPDFPWRTYFTAFSSGERVYITYESYGDTVEAEDINELQQATTNLGAELQAEKQLTQAHRDDQENVHKVTKEQVGLGNADNVADQDKPVSGPQQTALNALRQETETALKSHEDRINNPHQVLKSQVGLGNAEDTADRDKPVSVMQAAAIQAVQTALEGHQENQNNIHGVTKTQVGLSEVDNVKQATKAEFDAHDTDEIRHISQEERSSWQDRYTRNEVDNKLSALETAIDWKEAVNSLADIAATYPTPEDGWTVNVKDTDYTYRYSGTEWVAISANAIPKATQSIDGLLSKEDKAGLDSAVKHGSDAVKHVTAAERVQWNTVTGKVDQVAGKGLSSNDYTAAEKTKLAGIATNADNYTHPATHPATIITGLSAVATSGSYNDLLNKPANPEGLPTTGVTWNQLKGVK